MYENEEYGCVFTWVVYKQRPPILRLRITMFATPPLDLTVSSTIRLLTLLQSRLFTLLIQSFGLQNNTALSAPIIIINSTYLHNDTLITN